MSRRKQANPRPLKELEEEVNPDKETNKAKYAMLVEDVIPDDPDSDQDLVADGFDEYGPLVVDTSGHEHDDDDGKDNEDRLDPVGLSSLGHSQDNIHHSTEAGKVLDISNHENKLLDCITNSNSNLSGSVPSSISPSDQYISQDSSLIQTPSKSDSRRGSKTINKADQDLDVFETEAGSDQSKILPVSTEKGDSSYICPICQQVLATDHDLTVHIRTHNNNHNSSQSNSCTICGKLLSSQSSLDRHMLVHSGERPFKCKICKMSFTTNGNMHRHSRIHAKETDINSLGSKANQRRKNSWKPKIHFFVPSNNSGHSATLQEPHLSGEITPDFKPQTFNLGETSTPNDKVFAGVKRSFNFVDCSPDWSLPAAKRQYFGQNFSSELSKHLKGEIPFESKKLPLKVVQSEDQQKEKTIQSHQNQNPLPLQDQENHQRDHHLDNRSSQQNHSIIDEDKDTDQLHCPVCNKAFLCKYGLETHMETHPESSMKCHICQMSFPTRRGLNMHRLLIHSKSRSSESDDEKTTVVGFYDLSFVDFAVNKFSLIAKSWCEDNSRKSSSAYHNFACKDCSKAFPCKSALLLHQHTHIPEKTAQCPLCECDFLDSQKLHVHMVKHISDKAFDDLRQLATGDKENLNPDNMCQQDFLGMMGLTTSKDHISDKHNKEKEPTKESILNVEKNENNDYFAKLGQVFSSSVPPIHPFFKYADEMPKDFAEFQKMLQNAASQGLMAMPNQLGHLNPGMEHLARMHPSQLSAFMPSMLPFGLNPNMPGFGAMAAMMNANMMHAMSNHNLSSPLPTPPPSSDGGSGGSGSSGEIPEQKGSFACKYCDMVFPNYRMLKGHTRTHLGLSPYKCNLCSYSSADKSTLIRHLRTHNGERPFQCRVCDFAFTTKANCERHVRKKHGKNTRDDIEGAIGYNKYVTDSSNTVDSFHSPDTVCKYCGVDFKFFRALKHHLRSHSSCRQKPFMCTRCDVGFSSKANCVRHLQKQHAEISPNKIESCIHVNEPALSIDDGDNSTCDSVSDDGYPMDALGRSNEIPSLLAEKLSAPPAAHSTPKLSITPTDSRQGSPLMMKKEPVYVKSEPMDVPEDKPLDFSVKQNDITPKHNGDLNSKSYHESDETPIDLTIRKTGDNISPLAAHMSKISPHSKVQYDSNHFQCQFCPMGFSNQRLLERHSWHHHTHLAGMLESKPLFTPTYPAVPPDHLSMGGKLKLPIKLPVAVDHSVSKADIVAARRAEILSRLPNILQKKKKNRDIGSPNNYGSDSSNDLASVKKILDATHPHKFQAFLHESMGDSDISSQGDDGVFDDSRVEDPDMPEISGSESGLSLVNEVSDEPPVLSPPVRGDNESSDGRGDEDMPEIMNQVRELVKHVDRFKNESRSNTPRSLSENVDNKNLIKKKRNSYADSPHKLSCPYCTRTFPWVSSLTRHLLTHTGQKPFKCPRCPVTFSTKSNRERHLIRKHGVNMLDPLSRQTMDRPYKCHLCVFSSFSTQGNLLKHYKERHAGCTLPKSLADLDKAVTVGLSRNARDSPLVDGEVMDESEMMEDMLDNSMTRSELDQLDKSMEYERPHDRFIMDMKDDEEEDEEEENQSPAKMEDIMKPFCSPAEQNINPDLKTLQLNEMTKINEMRMNAINAEIKMNELRQQTVFNIPDMEEVKPFAGTGERQINPERDNYNVDKITECWKCTEKFSSRKLLVRHLKEHNIDLPFKCYLCDASYEVRQECLLHQEKFHSSDWNILKDKNKVDEIEKFSAHMDKVVENNINKVDTGAVLEIPGQNADDPKMEVVSADYMQRKVYCSLCPKRFWSLQDLRRHMRSHTGERPFECDICQKRFTLKHSMMRHRKKHMESGSLSPSDDEDTPHTEDLSKSGSSKSLTKLPLPPIVPSAVPVSLGESMNGESSVESRSRYGIAGPSTMLGSAPTIIKVDSKDSNDNSADMLHNLLGVDATSIDKMLDSADTASLMLGFN